MIRRRARPASRADRARPGAALAVVALASLETLAGCGTCEPERQRAVAPQAELRSDDWLALAARSRLVAKDPRTGREIALRGPARARVCVESREESWIAAGALEGALGSGEAPGAEEWVVTPLGVVRFGAAKVTVEALPREVRVHVAEGVTRVWVSVDAVGHAADGERMRATDEGWVRAAEGGFVLTPAAARSPLDAARSALGACSALAASTRELAGALLARDADRGAPDAATAAAQVTTRRLARAACAVTALRLAQLPQSDVKATMARSLDEASAAWRSLPAAPP